MRVRVKKAPQGAGQYSQRAASQTRATDLWNLTIELAFNQIRLRCRKPRCPEVEHTGFEPVSNVNAPVYSRLGGLFLTL